MFSATPAFFLVLPHLALLPIFDDGYDYMIVDVPRRVVVGDDLDITARCRPGNAYSIFLDVAKQRRLFGRVPVHLSGAGLVHFASGQMSASGEVVHKIAVPAIPALDGLDLFCQGFCADMSIIGGIGASQPRTVTFHRDDGQPLIRLLTVNRISADNNGSENREGMLRVPPSGFSIDLVFDTRGQGPIDLNSLVVTADQALGNGSVAAGTNLAQRFTVLGHSARAIVDSTWSFPRGVQITMTATVKNQNGKLSPSESLKFDSDNHSTSRPFATTQLWWLDFQAHDLDGSNVPDFREDLVLFGLGNNASAQTGPAADAAKLVTERILAAINTIYQVGQPRGVNIDFFLNRPTQTHARMCIGGRNSYPANQLPPGATQTTGAAYLNPRNQRKNIVDCFGVVGVHPRSIFNLFKNVPAFQTTFGPLQQNPVGNDPLDAIVLSSTFNPNQATVQERLRYLQIDAGVEAVTRATSFVLTQETCHSMGLVTPSILPSGQLGGERYGASTPYHSEDGQGNFMSGNNSTPAPSQPPNLAMIWDHWQSGRAHFTALNWAYLTETAIQR